MTFILVLEPLDRDIIENMRKSYSNLGLVIDYQPSFDTPNIAEIIGPYEAIVVGSHKIDENIINIWSQTNSSNRKIIVRAGTGTSTIDKAAAAKNRIAVINTPGTNSRSVAEYVIKRMLDLYYYTLDQQLINDLKNGFFSDRSPYYHHTLYDKTLALIGTGYIGSQIAKRARALDINIKAYSPNFTPEKAKVLGVEYCATIEQALQGVDIVSIQVPWVTSGTHPTAHMLTEQHLNLLNDNAVIINMSKAEVIDIDSLVGKLKSKKLSGLAQEGTRKEVVALKESYPELWTIANTFISPSCSTASVELRQELTIQVFKNISEYWLGNQKTDRDSRQLSLVQPEVFL